MWAARSMEQIESHLAPHGLFMIYDEAVDTNRNKVLQCHRPSSHRDNCDTILIS